MDADLGGDQAANGDQHRVAGGVAVLEVQIAKPVDVEQGHRQRALIALGARDVALELGPEGAEAEQVRSQRVSLGEPHQIPLELADPLASSRKLLGQVFAVPPAHLRLSIGSLVRRLRIGSLEGSRGRGVNSGRAWAVLREGVKLHDPVRKGHG